MGEKLYTYWLADGVYLVVEFVTVRGRVMSFVVRLMLEAGEGPVCIARYDTAHGMPHRDVVDKRGHLKEKDWLFDTSLDDALSLAISDLRRNYEEYVKKA